jgi:hypothetical protein
MIQQNTKIRAEKEKAYVLGGNLPFELVSKT